MKIILVAANPESSAATPLGPASLAAWLGSALAGRGTPDAATVELRSFSPRADPGFCARELAAAGADVVGFSVYLWNRDFCLGTAELLGQASRPGGARRPFIVAGGPEAGSRPGPFLSSGAFDAVVEGEGEGAFLRIVDACLAGRPESVRGLVDGNALRVERLDEIPSPYLAGIVPASGGILWELSRGCPFSCAYCCEGRGHRGVRRFGTERLEKELELFARSGTTEVFVLDATFNIDPERAKDILRLIARTAPDCYYYFEIRPEFIDGELAGLFASLDCSVQIGLQSADPAVCAGAGRRLDPADFAEKIALLNEAGVVFGFDLIYGLPGDSLPGFRKSLDFAFGFGPNHLDVFRLLVLGMTDFGERAAGLGLTYDPEPPYALRAAPGFGAGDLAAAGRLARALDIFYVKGRAVAWFMALMRLLGARPSAFLDGFAGYLAGERPGLLKPEFRPETLSPAALEELQTSYCGAALRDAGAGAFAPIVTDVIRYNGAYARLMLAPEDPGVARAAGTAFPAPAGRGPQGRPAAFSPEASFRLSSTAELLRFSYPVDLVYEAGGCELRELVRGQKPAADACVMYRAGPSVKTESMDAGYFTLLERLAKGLRVEQAASGLKVSPRDLGRFLAFCTGEGILVPRAAGGTAGERTPAGHRQEPSRHESDRHESGEARRETEGGRGDRARGRQGATPGRSRTDGPGAQKRPPRGRPR